MSSANLSFHRVLRGGLAANLRSLVLRSICDNEILRLLGHHCPHLRHLDATSSWLVDDNGLRSLCFKVCQVMYSKMKCPFLENMTTCRYMARVHCNISNSVYGEFAYIDHLKVETGISCRYVSFLFLILGTVRSLISNLIRRNS